MRGSGKMQRWCPRAASLAVFGCLSALVLGCSGTMATARRAPDGTASGYVYPLSVGQGESVVRSVFAETFPVDRITKQSFPNITYTAGLRTGLDSHVIVATIMPAVGQGPDGAKVDGVVFNVHHRGTMMISGTSRAKKTFKRIVADAYAVAPPVPLLYYGSLPKPKQVQAKSRSPTPKPVTKPIVSGGTCFVTSKSGRAVTAYHVVEEADLITVRLRNGDSLVAELEHKDARNDIAILRLNGRPADVLPLATARSASLGTAVFTIGFPAEEILGSKPKFTGGTVSALSGIGDDASLMQVSVPVHPGNSGGPLVTDDGRAIGLVTSTAHAGAFLAYTGSLPQNVSWAVKADYVMPLVEEPARLAPTRDRSEAIRRAERATCAVRAVRRP